MLRNRKTNHRRCAIRFATSRCKGVFITTQSHKALMFCTLRTTRTTHRAKYAEITHIHSAVRVWNMQQGSAGVTLYSHDSVHVEGNTMWNYDTSSVAFKYNRVRWKSFTIVFWGEIWHLMSSYVIEPLTCVFTTRREGLPFRERSLKYYVMTS